MEEASTDGPGDAVEDYEGERNERREEQNEIEELDRRGKEVEEDEEEDEEEEEEEEEREEINKPEKSKIKKGCDGTTSILWPEGSWSATFCFSTLVPLWSVETVASRRHPWKPKPETPSNLKPKP